MKVLKLGLLFCVLLATSCKNKTDKVQEQIDNLFKYKAYISNVSPALISAHSDIRVVLREPSSALNSEDELDASLFSISPKVKGKVVALNKQTISFQPEEPLAQDTEYTLTLKLDKLVKDIPSDYKKFSFKTKTYKQQFNVVTGNIQSYNKNWQYLEGTIRTSDKLALQTAKKLLQATQNKKPLTVKFADTEPLNNIFSFKIDSIQRFDNDSQILVTWNGNPFNIETQGENTLTIPGKNNFSVIDVSVVDADEQYVEINFSDALKKNQNFNGLVALQNAGNLKFTVNGNVLKVFPSKEVKGATQLEIFQGIESTDGFKLKNIFSESIAFEQLKPQVRLLSSGSILPSSNNLKVNFEAVNLTKVDVSVIKIFEDNIMQFLQFNNLEGNQYLRNVGRPVATKTITLQNSINPSNASKFRAYAVDLKELITPEQGAIYRVEFNFKPQYSSYKCNSSNFSDLEEEENYDEAQETSAWDGIENYYYYDDFSYDYDWYERDNPCHTSYYRNKKVAANILASDIGLTVKKGANNSYLVGTSNLITAEPMPNVQITFYNFQQQEIGSVITDNDGLSIFDSDHLAYFAIAEKNNQKTYVKLNDGNALSMSKFNIAGAKLQKGIKGFLYGERGVWRPGDTLFLSFILNDKANKLPQNHPVKFELKDPYGKITHREVQTQSIDNFYRFTTTTKANAPTGNWQAKVNVGGASFTKRIKIETIKPNRLKIKVDFDDKVLSASNPVNGNLAVTWLHGAIAKNLKADVQAKFNQTNTTFTAFPNYVFDDPTRKFSTEEQAVFTGTINQEGKVNFRLQPQIQKKAPGKLKAAFITKVYENGGDFSTDVFTKEYSPYKTYVGLNTPKGDATRGMLLTDQKHTFDVATVDENGKPKATKGLKVSIYKVRWRWWWDTSADNLSSYNGSQQRETVFTKTIDTDTNGKATFRFELKYPNWGRYLVRIEDPSGGHATGKAIYIDWPGWAGKSRKNDPSSATMLVFSTDKEKYNVGEKATITFPSSGEGRALVTVENGTEVLQSLWVTPTKGETKFELPMQNFYAPNVFIHISLLQPHASTKNDLPIRLYGVVPVSVENPQTKLQPQITMPDVLRPEEKINLKVKEQSGKPMTYTVAIVDDGLLDLTRFKTPNPWNTFFAREALGVKTWDMFDDVIGAFGGRIDQIFSIGGDEEAAGAKNKKANRFKPMVVYLGPFTLNAKETKSHTIKVPKYVGSVRTMVIAGDVNSEAFGVAEKTTPVRKPLMVLASLPRKITPGEKVTLPVTVFAMEKKVKNVTIKLKKDASFKVIGEETQTLSFTNPDEKMAYFNLEVSDFNGIGKVIVEASGNGEKASYEVEIDVVNPNPVTIATHNYILEPNATKDITLETFGINGSNTAQIEFSTLPSMDFSGRLQYLIRYPHGCVEQTTSAAFPQLFLADIFDLTFDKKKKIQQNIEQAITRLANYQLPNGGFSYWSGQNYANDWGTSYAGHFLIEAEKKGYVLPIGFKSAWTQYQKQASKQWRKSNNSSDLAQAYRLYTLALSGNADVSSMNRLRETPNISNEAKHRLAATYAIIGQQSAAKEIYNNANIDYKPVKYDYYTYGSIDRNRAMALETLILLNNKSQAQEMAKSIANRLNDKRWLSTQTTAYSLLSMAKFASYIGGKGVAVTYSVNGASQEVASQKTMAGRTLAVKDGNNSINLKNNKDNTLFVNVISAGILPVGQEKEAQSNLTAQVVYKDRNGKQIEVSELSQGTNFIAEVTITNKKGEAIKDVALTEIMPSGWEIVNTRFTDFGSFKANNVTYTDLRDDRAHFYFDLKARESKTFRILLNASYLGNYYLPGIQCEAMYDNDFLVRTKGKWVTVVK
jgi:hypothetical protein